MRKVSRVKHWVGETIVAVEPDVAIGESLVPSRHSHGSEMNTVAEGEAAAAWLGQAAY
jgi:hypothetical protein